MKDIKSNDASSWSEVSASEKARDWAGFMSRFKANALPLISESGALERSRAGAAFMSGYTDKTRSLTAGAGEAEKGLARVAYMSAYAIKDAPSLPMSLDDADTPSSPVDVQPSPLNRSAIIGNYGDRDVEKRINHLVEDTLKFILQSPPTPSLPSKRGRSEESQSGDMKASKMSASRAGLRSVSPEIVAGGLLCSGYTMDVIAHRNPELLKSKHEFASDLNQPPTEGRGRWR